MIEQYESEKYRLTIKHDDSPESPREWSNLGYFITIDSKYYSPDKNDDIINIVAETGREADSVEDHIKRICESIEDYMDEKVLWIRPVCKYEHSGIDYSLGTKHGFDYSNNGFYIITDKTANEVGVEEKDFELVVNEELEVYNQYANGEVYRFLLEQKIPYKRVYENESIIDNDIYYEYEEIDSCGGFYGYDIQKNGMLEYIEDEIAKDLKLIE